MLGQLAHATIGHRLEMLDIDMAPAGFGSVAQLIERTNLAVAVEADSGERQVSLHPGRIADDAELGGRWGRQLGQRPMHQVRREWNAFAATEASQGYSSIEAEYD